jgi:hypothetical protein
VIERRLFVVEMLCGEDGLCHRETRAGIARLNLE